MAKASPAVVAFTGGEWDSALDGRIDLDGYRTACKTLENMIPTVQGPVTRRGGTYHLGSVKDATDRTWLVRYQRSASRPFVLEFGDGYIRFWKDRGRLRLGSTPTAWANATAYTEGDLVSEGGVNYYCYSDHTSGAATRPGVGASWTDRWHALEDDIYEIRSPYSAAELEDDYGRLSLRFAQVGATLYIAGAGIKPRKLRRVNDTRWIIDQVNTLDGPFEDVNTTASTVYSDAATGSVTLTASSAIFNSDHVGSLFYLERESDDDMLSWEPGKAITSGTFRRSIGLEYEAQNNATTGTIQPVHISGGVYDGDSGVRWKFRTPGYGTVRIESIGGGGTTAGGTVESRLPQAAVGAGDASENWAFSLFSDDAGWPNLVGFFRGRLVFAKQQTMAFSVAGDYENFADKFFGAVTDDMAVTLTVASTQANNINFMVPTSNGLILGTDGEELICSELSDSIPFGPSNAGVQPQTAVGSTELNPVQVNDNALFVQRDGKTVREIGYSYEVNGYRTRNMSVRAPHVTLAGVRDWTYQASPHSVVWGCDFDGALFGFTYDREQDVYAWHRHPLGGDGIVESVVCVPSPDNDRDDLYLIVRRTIDGNSVRHIEYMTKGHERGDALEDSFFVDAGLTYDGAATTSITGLDHLEGETVTILADGAPHADKTVASGAITLDRSASVVQVGLQMSAKALPMRLEAGASDGTAQGKTKRFNKVVFRLKDTVGFKCGPSESNLEQQDFRNSGDDMSAAVPMFTGDKIVEWPGGYETDGYIWFVQDQPLPATLVAIFPQVTTQDTR